MNLSWQWSRLEELSALQWHEVGVLRQTVFVVEQACPYPDLDQLDPVSLHLLGRDEAGQLQACLRLVPAGMKFDAPSIGRVVTSAQARGTGAGKALMLEGLAEHRRRYPGQPNRIAGQLYLRGFYESLGFVPFSDIYLEDDIEHINMAWMPAH
ncbi:GNAT family N-acetyltransferase [Chitinimonas arctica]|uniref:GNAT family N-acetyltransferase n=1 Tax=Chitinimonas arctica TaxID=2594795 RepID=A0A516SF37_9NEIS|nr:GNAT family N-acetyltransferase [Chitinimonas arctica]QDQ26781.1 GNAT family N-acetyltransferase [Chitinimonas arctica]